MSNEDTCMVWMTMSSVIVRLKKLVEYTDDATQAKFLTFGQTVLKQIRETVTWDPQPNESLSF